MVKKSVTSMIGSGFETVKNEPGVVGLSLVAVLLNGGSELFRMSGRLAGAAILISLVGSVVGMGVRAYAEMSHYNRVREKSVSWIGRFAGRFLTLIGISIITVIGVFIGLLLLIIPGIYISLKLVLAPTICIIEDESVISSLKKSWKYTEGNLLEIIGISLVSFMISFVLIAGGAIFAIVGSIYPPVAVVIVLAMIVSLSVVSVTVQAAYADLLLEIKPEEDAGNPGEYVDKNEFTEAEF
jgi:hypothetical protein